MPRPSKDRIAGQYFTWTLFARDGVWYADGRANTPSLGKHSLATRARAEALRALHDWDRRKAVELKLAKPAAHDAAGYEEVTITDGWERYLAHVARSAVLGGANARTQAR